MQAVKGAWFHSEGCRAVDAELARLAAAGLMPVQAAPTAPSDLAPAWQLVRGTAVSAPQVRPEDVLLTSREPATPQIPFLPQVAHVEETVSKH